MADEIVTLDSDTITSVVGATRIEIIELARQGPPGPAGDAGLPDAATLANGRMLAVLDGEYVDVPPPAGTGDMQTLIYDPRGIATDAFVADNLTGIIDGGRFT
jgi:hypothetical protein